MIVSALGSALSLPRAITGPPKTDGCPFYGDVRHKEMSFTEGVPAILSFFL